MYLSSITSCMCLSSTFSTFLHSKYTLLCSECTSFNSNACIEVALIGFVSRDRYVGGMNNNVFGIDW